jgi:hypothetical protein
MSTDVAGSLPSLLIAFTMTFARLLARTPATSVLMTLCPMVIARADLAEVERVKETVRPVLERIHPGGRLES